jgi:hypothetical protein
MASDEDVKKPSYAWAAFANVYNLTALAGVTVAGLATGEAWLVGVGFAAEALWLLFVPDSARFRRAIDAQTADLRRVDAVRRMTEESAMLPSELRQRVQQLGTRAADVKAEVKRNPRISGAFMESQLGRLDALVGEFVHLSLTTFRAEAYIARSDSKQINRDREQQRKIIETTEDDGARAIAQQNREILEKRLKLIDELARFGQRARGQLSLIENTIALLRDQVMTMATPEALSTQLDEIITSVEALREATNEVDAMMGTPAPSGTSADDRAAREAGAPEFAPDRLAPERPGERRRDRT